MANDKPFKVGDPVAFEHMGMEKTGTIIELADGKVRLKDGRGLMYRYAPENVSHLGDPIVKDPKVMEPKATQQPINKTNPMENNEAAAPAVAKEKAPKAPKAAPAAGTADAETVKKIIGLTCKKHQRIFLLLDAGCTKEEICTHMKANFGEVSNARKMYAESAEKTAEAKALLA